MTRRFVGKSMEKRRVRGIVQFPLSKSGDQNLKHGSERASSWDPIPIPRPTENEDHDSRGHGGCDDAVSDSPADIILDVDDQGDAEKQAATESEVPPIEERHLLDALRVMIIVELIGAEAL